MFRSPKTNPNTPQMVPGQYLVEKNFLAGYLISSMLYGIVIVLFFRCMGALLNPINRKTGGINWGLVAHTAAMFSALSINIVTNLDIESISYIDNREFPGTHSLPVPGPYGWQLLINPKAISVVPIVMFFMNTFLADGFLLYRCYVIYSKNCWIMVLPCLMYLTSLGMCIFMLYYQTLPMNIAAWNAMVSHFGLAYYSISLSLNVLLTLMIATRLIRHSRNIRNSLGKTADGGLYNTVVIMLVESCALYAIISLLSIGSLAAVKPIEGVFVPILMNIQVIAPYLILLRVANRTALTSDAITSRKIGSIRFRGRGVSMTPSGGDPAGSMETNGVSSAGAEDIIEEVPSR